MKTNSIYKTVPKGNAYMNRLYEQTQDLIALKSDNKYIKALIRSNIDKIKETRIIYDYKIEW